MSRARIHRRLDRVEGALAVARPPDEANDDRRELAAELAAAFGLLVGHYRDHHQLSPDEARARAADTPDQRVERSLTCPPSAVSWNDLERIERRDPAQALARWQEIKDAARGEVRSGHRAARALEGLDSCCWTRARFLAIRSELSAAWRPRNAAEQHLIDQMAQAQELIWQWQDTLTAYYQTTSSRSSRGNGIDQRFNTPRVSDADALEQAARMVERFHAMYLRSLAALRQLRRQPPVVVRTAGQVNIGQQQVNVTTPG